MCIGNIWNSKRQPYAGLLKNFLSFLQGNHKRHSSSFCPSLFSVRWRFIAAQESAVNASHRTNRSTITFLSFISYFLLWFDISVIPFPRKWSIVCINCSKSARAFAISSYIICSGHKTTAAPLAGGMVVNIWKKKTGCSACPTWYWWFLSWLNFMAVLL